MPATMSAASPTTVMMKSPLDSSTHSYSSVLYKSKLENIPEAQNRHNRQYHQQHHQHQQQHHQQHHRHADSSVQVAVRIRPLLPFENGNTSCVEVFPEEADTTILKSMSSGSTATNSTFPAWSSNESQFSDNKNSQSNIISPSNSISSYRSLQIAPEKNNQRSHTYTFDHVFPSSTPQIDLYEKCVTPLVQSCVEGYNATVLAYGQTGSGKTFTILGENSGEIDDMEGTRSNEGVIPRALKQIFNALETMQYDIIRNSAIREEDVSFGDAREVEQNIKGPMNSSGRSRNDPLPFEYQVKIQFLEVYGEDIRDLLVDSSDHGKDENHDTNQQHDDIHQLQHRYKRPSQIARQSSYASVASIASHRTATGGGGSRSTISIRDGKTGEDAEVLGANQLRVINADEALQHLHNGLSKRIVGKTAMNAQSSRSHAIFTIMIQQTRRSKSGESGKINVEMKTSKIHIVDLSGSERVKRSMTIGKSLKEGIDINKGLLVLGNVISALSSNKRGSKPHVPYRDSKLTRLLKGSLGGNHKTLMIACVSPSSSNKIESNNTLRYANRAKNIQNKAKINVDKSSRVVNELKEQVVALAAQLLKERRKRESNEDYDEDVDDCPFSIEFLDELVSGANSKSLWEKNKIERPTPADRPKTEPLMSPSRPGRNNESLVSDSWEASDTGIKTMFELSPSRSSDDEETVEDDDMDKDIVSYDFALRKLRESFEEKSNLGTTKEESDRAVTPSLGKVKNIGELYDYLNKPKSDMSDIVESPSSESEESDSEESDSEESDSEESEDSSESDSAVTEPNNQVTNVVKSHITKLDETLAHNETLLVEMTKCHRRYEALMTEYMSELEKIQTQVNSYDKDRKKFENVIDLIEEGSQYSDSMVECLKDYEVKLDQLEEKRNELKVLSQVANQNDEEIQNLRHSMELVRKQRDRMKQIMKRDVFPPDYTRLPGEDPRSRSFQGMHRKHDMPPSDQFRDRNASQDEESRQIVELRQEIRELRQRLHLKEINDDFQKQTNNFEEQFGTVSPMHERQDINNHIQSKNQVPRMLNLKSNSADFSALGTLSHEGLVRRLSNPNGSADADVNQTFLYQPNPSMMTNRQERLKYDLITQINKDSDQIFQNKARTSEKNEKDYIYDLGAEVKETSLRTTKRRNKKSKKSRKKSKEKQVDCEEICAGASHVVQLIRAFFGTKKDPVVRQW